MSQAPKPVLDLCTDCEHDRSYHNHSGCRIDQCGCMKFTRRKQKTQTLAALVLDIQTTAEAMRLVDFNERKQEFWCRVCRYRDPLRDAGNKLHDDNCPYKAFVEAMGRLHAFVTGVPNFVSEDGR